VANKLAGMLLNELSRAVSQSWPVRVDSCERSCLTWEYWAGVSQFEERRADLQQALPGLAIKLYSDCQAFAESETICAGPDSATA
jgi:hypothetical protein